MRSQDSCKNKVPMFVRSRGASGDPGRDVITYSLSSTPTASLSFLEKSHYMWLTPAIDFEETL